MARVAEESFFDLEFLKQPKFFKKVNQNQNSFEYYQKATFQKATKKEGVTKQRTFFLTNKYMYISDSNNSFGIKGKVNLTCVKIKFIEDLDSSEISRNFDCKKIYGIFMSKNGRTCDIFTSNKNDYYKFKEFLSLRAIQTTFHDQFTVTKMIGKGSFAKVYLAHKKNNPNKFYAIKAFNQQYMKEQHLGVQQLINEIKVMREIDHSNLLHLYEVYETVNSIYFVVDLVEGGELLNRFKDKERQIDEYSKRGVIKSILEALQHMNERNLVHRDLKPENILLKNKHDDNEVVIADFGLATKMKKPQDILFKRCGTPGFVAPEILSYKDGQPFYDKKCDVFSVGVILHLLQTGEQPFQGDDYKQILKANKKCNIDFNHARYNKINQLSLDLMKRLLVPNPTDRISIDQALQHPYIITESFDINYTQDEYTNQIKKYQYEFLYNLKVNKGSSNSVSSQGSLALKQGSLNGFKGNTDTINSMSSRGSINLKHEMLPPQRKLIKQSTFCKEKLSSTYQIEQIPIKQRTLQKKSTLQYAIMNNMKH